MRPVHLERLLPGGLVRPLCGDWGSMDTGWTGEPDEVTCPACRAPLERAGGAAAAPPPGDRP